MVLLAWALYPRNPYGYYVFLRWVCCPLFVYLAVRSADLRHGAWMWIFGVLAIVYNPIFRFHATRGFWSVVNVGTIVVVVASLFMFRTKNAAPSER